jgi:hypothetical protein
MKSNKNISKTILAVVTLLTCMQSNADEMSIVDVKRNITLSDEDTVYKDYYINAGDGSALRKNMVINVKRKIYIKDLGTKSVGDFEALVGQLKIIQVGNKVSVAREFKLTPRDQEAMLEQIGIMSGDKLDLTGSFIDNSKPSAKRVTADATEFINSLETDTPKPSPAAVEAPTAASETPDAAAASHFINPTNDNTNNREPASQPATLKSSSPIPLPDI